MNPLRWNVQSPAEFTEQRQSEIAALWQADTIRNPFTAPHYLAAMANSADADGMTPVLAEGRTDEGLLMAVWPLRLDSNGRLGFLQYMHCDQCSCLYRPEVSVDDLAEGVASAIRELKPRTAEMHPVPGWSHTLEALQKGFQRAGWKTCEILANVCPIVEGENTEEGREAFKKRFASKSWRNAANRVKRQDGYAIVTDEGGDDLEEWIQDFADAHELRWNDTHTPSRYRSQQARKRLLSVMRGWLSDGLLVRFTLWIEGRRVAQDITLKCGERLICHHASRRTDMEKLSVGKALQQAIAFWMADNGYTCLDFGFGDEAYKVGLATGEEPIWRICASSSACSPFYLRACLERKIRSSERLLTVARAVKRRQPGHAVRALLQSKNDQD